MRRHLARAAVAAALIGLTAGCGGSSSSSTTSSNPVAPVEGGTATGTGPAAAGAFVPIVEPFDPGHPAQVRSAPASCASQPTTLAIEQCYQAKTESTDAGIDAVRQAAYQSGSAAKQAAILAQDSAWLAARGPVCQAAFNTGGTINGVSVAACLLDESTARLNTVKGITPQEASLKATDSIDPNQLSWYTTPEGSRIAEISTQGDRPAARRGLGHHRRANGFVDQPQAVLLQRRVVHRLRDHRRGRTPPTTGSRPR